MINTYYLWIDWKNIIKAGADRRNIEENIPEEIESQIKKTKTQMHDNIAPFEAKKRKAA